MAEKIPGAMHPGVAANRAKVRPILVSIVYDKDGRPRIERDFVENLTPQLRKVVDENLAARGWRLNDNLEAEEIK